MSDHQQSADGVQHPGPTLPSLQQSLQGPGSKRYRSTPAKTFQCTGFGDCRMVFSRSEHLARHIRLVLDAVDSSLVTATRFLFLLLPCAVIHLPSLLGWSFNSTSPPAPAPPAPAPAPAPVSFLSLLGSPFMALLLVSVVNGDLSARVPTLRKKHTGERPFTCHCSKQFSRLDNLRQHAQTVHADKPEQNEKMMKELTSLHSSMSAASGNAKRPSKRAARVAEMASHQQQQQQQQQQAFAPQDAPPPPRPPSGFDQNANPYGAHPVPFAGQHMPYLPQDGTAHYAHHQQPYGDPHAPYQTSYPLSDSFSYQQQQHHHQHQQPPQLHVQPGYPGAHPMYDYNHRTGSDGESPVDNHPPPTSAHDSHPSQSPATPTSGIVPPSATSLHAPHPQSAYGQYAHPHHSHPHPHHHHNNGIPYPSRSPLPTPPPQSFRQPLRGVRDGAAGGDYYQPPTLPQQHSYQHYVQQRQSISTPHLPGSSPSPHPGAGSGNHNSSSVALPDNVQVKREEYAHLPPLVKAEQYEPPNNYRFHDGGSNGIPSRASSTSLSEQQQQQQQQQQRDTGQQQQLSRLNGGSPPPLVGHQQLRGGNDSAAGVFAGSFGGEQRFPSEFYNLQHQEQQQHGQHFRGRLGHLPQHDGHGLGQTTTKERSPPDQHVPVSPIDLDEANDRPGTAPAAFTHNGQSLARPATSASSSSPAPAQSSRFASHAMATTADKYYAGISGFREPLFDHATATATATAGPTAGSTAAFDHNRGSNSPPFRFGAPSPQQGRVDLEHQQYQSASSFAPVRRSPTGGTHGTPSASSRPGNVLRPLPGWTNSAPIVSGSSSVHATSDSPFSFHPPSLGHSFSSTNSRKRPYPDGDEYAEQPRPVSSRPATRSGLDDEQPRPTSRRLSVMELCNTRSGGGGSGLPDGFDNRPRTSSGRFPAPSAGSNPTGNGPSSSFSFPASPSNANFSHHHPNGLRPSSSSGALSTTAFQLAPPVGSTSGPASSSSIFAYSLPGNASTGPSGGGSRPSSSAGRGLEQYSLNLGASSRPGTASAQWNSSRGPAGGNGDDEPGLKAGSGIVLPPLHLSSPSPTSATTATTIQSAGTLGSGHDAPGGFGRGGDGRSRDGLAGSFVAHQSRVPTSPHGLRA
ncbi:hypothetical protein PIIN_06334 [Serendipita indica DSM 11827]|uniref:C2H2-type domain-containing protein n=1 Tax=Serendipita indica (strain DSM 11827) TaxID=1109443 RepID=G4TM57_SERID|nr:hypothetical protein PIIN_06334 [Serendipita indica DSM 11827]